MQLHKWNPEILEWTLLYRTSLNSRYKVHSREETEANNDLHMFADCDLSV